MTKNKHIKVLYINPFDNTGYGQAARDLVLAMDSVGIDVIPRPLIVSGNKPNLDGRLGELAKKDASGCNVVIQHILPHLIEYNGHFDHNICLFASETESFNDSNWATYLNLMDDIWVINSSQLEACHNSGIRNKSIKVIPHAFDANKLLNRSTVNLPCSEDDIIIYTVGEFVRRKNLPSLLKAFHIEFDRTENVQLLLKLNKSSVNPDTLRQEVGKMLNEIKAGLKLYTNLNDYKQELLLTEHLSDEQLIGLHNSCDIYCSSSFGEAWNIPLFDAAALGNFVISTNEGGPRDYLSSHPYCILVDSVKESCFGFCDSFSNLYTAREEVNSISIKGLRKAMRDSYEKLKEKKKGDRKNIEAGIELARKYSYNKVGNLIKSILES